LVSRLDETLKQIIKLPRLHASAIHL